MSIIEQRSERAATPRLRGTQAGRARKRVILRRRALAAVVVIAALVGATLVIRDDPAPPAPSDIRGSEAWARKYFGDADGPRFRERNIVEIEFLGEPMYVHEKVQRHFLRLARLFEARAPEYAAAIATGTSDDWSYGNRDVRGASSKSLHAFGIAIDVNALTNPVGTAGDMPEEVVRQWEIEGGEWGGDWSRPDPMHFESHLTPKEIRERYHPDGTPRDWYLEELTGG